MKRKDVLWTIVAAVLASAMLWASPLSGPSEFATIDVPGSASTRAMGIDPGGDVVGDYIDNIAGHTHGFLLSGGSFFSIDFPGAIATGAKGIGPGGDIVGSYTNSPGGNANIHGFLLSQGTFTEVQYPGKLGTIAQRIGPDGTIYGCNHDKDLGISMHGFVLSRGVFSQVEMPMSMNNGATPAGDAIVGLYTDSGGRTHDGWDISPAGLIVGQYRDTAGSLHGFLRSGDGYTTVDPPGSISAQAFGINAGGDIVGTYVDSGGKRHGFMRRRPK